VLVPFDTSYLRYKNDDINANGLLQGLSYPVAKDTMEKKENYLRLLNGIDSKCT
jgi:hypothetical protein